METLCAAIVVDRGQSTIVASILAAMRLRRALPLLALLGGTLACGSSPGAADDGGAAASATPARDEAAGTVADRMAAVAAADLAALLDVLAMPHLEARTAIGPHAMSYEADFALTGKSPPAHEGLPAVDTPVVDDQQVHDALTLRVASSADEPLRLALTQSNDHERGRDVVVIGEAMYVRARHRPFVAGPVSPDLVEVWLDDAQHSVHDAVELAASAATMSVQPRAGAGLGGGEALVITLTGGDGITRPTEHVRRGWRAKARVESVDGEIVLDAACGAWLSAQVHVRFSLPAADGRSMAGTLDLDAAVTPGDPAPVEAPPDAVPLPSRTRLEVERARLLDGLAAP